MCGVVGMVAPAYGVDPAELGVQKPVLDEDRDGGRQDGRVQAGEEPGGLRWSNLKNWSL